MNRNREGSEGEGAPVSHEKPGTGMAQAPRSRLSMHDGVTVWCDCCSCEAEPYWAEVAGELGIDPDLGEARERDG